MSERPTAPTDDRAIKAISELPRDLAIVKMEQETIMSLAKAQKRDPDEILEHIAAQLRSYKSFAQEAIYVKPVGKDRETGKMKYARGPSIRMAEALAEAYGFNKVRCDVTIVDQDTVRVEATFTDYQRGRIWQDSGLVSKNYVGYNKQPRRHSDDRFYDVIVKAACSKRIREVILRSVPPGLRSELEAIVDKQLDSFLDEETVQKIVAQFSTKNVTAEMIEEHLGKRLASLTKEDRAILLGLWNAIKEGDQTVEGVFGAVDKETIEDDGRTRTEQAKDWAKGRRPATTPEHAPPSEKPPEQQPPDPTPQGSSSVPAQHAVGDADAEAGGGGSIPPAPADTETKEGPGGGETDTPKASKTPDPAPRTITAEQFGRMHELYGNLDRGHKTRFTRNLQGIGAFADLARLPADQFDDVYLTLVDIHAEYKFGDQSPQPDVEAPTANPAASAPLTDEEWRTFSTRWITMSPNQAAVAMEKLGVAAASKLRPPNPCPLPLAELLTLIDEVKAGKK